MRGVWQTRIVIFVCKHNNSILHATTSLGFLAENFAKLEVSGVGIQAVSKALVTDKGYICASTMTSVGVSKLTCFSGSCLAGSASAKGLSEGKYRSLLCWGCVDYGYLYPKMWYSSVCVFVFFWKCWKECHEWWPLPRCVSPLARDLTKVIPVNSCL